MADPKLSTNDLLPRSKWHRTDSPTDDASDDNMLSKMKKHMDQVIFMLTAILTHLQQQDTRPQNDDATASAAFDTQQNDQSAFLKQKLKELVDMNVGWQQMHQQQERRIADLEEQLREATRQLQASGFSVQQQENIDKQFLEQKIKYGQIEDEKRQLEYLVSTLERDRKAQDERIQVLDLQLMTNREDFEAERKDRERAWSHVAELETELQRYRSAPATYLPIQYPDGQLYVSRSSDSNQWRQQRPTGRYLVDTHDGLDTSDCVEDAPMAARGISTAVEGSSCSLADEKKLQCPNCHVNFTEDQQEQLMDHMDRCGS